jgi:hypothetical protein
MNSARGRPGSGVRPDRKRYVIGGVSSYVSTMDESQPAELDDLIRDARKRAESLMHGLGDRWAHVKGVVRAAMWTSPILDKKERPYLLAAAYLHDIGYAPSAAATGFHALDGAQYLRAVGEDWRVCCLVAHHSGARYEARERGLAAQLAAFELEDGPVMDALVFADMTTGPAGERTTLEHRLADIFARYGSSDPVRDAVRDASTALQGSVDRTRRRLAAGRP